MAIIPPEIQVFVCGAGEGEGEAPFGFLTPGLRWLTSVLQASVRNITKRSVQGRNWSDDWPFEYPTSL